MIARVLDPGEWAARLAAVPLGTVAPHLPAEARVIVVEDAGAVIATWAVLRYVHVEGLWIAPAHRGRGAVLRRLLGEMRRVAHAWGVVGVLTGAETPEVAAMIRAWGGTQLPGDQFVMPVERASCR